MTTQERAIRKELSFPFLYGWSPQLTDEQNAQRRQAAADFVAGKCDQITLDSETTSQ